MVPRRLDVRGRRIRLVVCLVLFTLGVALWLTFVIVGGGAGEIVLVKKVKLKTRTQKGFTTQFLAWTTKSGKSKWIPNNLRSLGCKVNTCKITEDRSKLEYSDVVIFHSKDVDPNDLPGIRLPDQAWVYLNHEPPTQTRHAVVQRLGPQINFTVSYRTDSDLFAPIYDLARRDGTETDQPVRFRKNRKLLTWLVSHCKTSSNREGYVRMLKKFIDVDIWGKCGKNFTKCPALGREECYKKLAQDYKFYLAFENSLCKDYVSEKLYLAMYAGMVPIVFGAANYSRILPPNSFINALDFEGPYELANFLLKIGSNEKLYRTFLEWRDMFVVVQRRYKWLCDLCALMTKGGKDKQNNGRAELTKWWFDDANCLTWSEKIK